jgi:hypothetical protein
MDCVFTILIFFWRFQCFLMIDTYFASIDKDKREENFSKLTNEKTDTSVILKSQEYKWRNFSIFRAGKA